MQLLRDKGDFFADKLTSETRQRIGDNQINFLDSLKTNTSSKKRERVTFFEAGREKLDPLNDSSKDVYYSPYN